jgi:CRISPR-associated protein Cas2
MAINQPVKYVVCYDIADPRRLVRVHRHLRDEGLALQYSVFNVCLTERQLRNLLAELDGLIESSEDDVRVYPLPSRGERRFLGRQLFPEDVMLIQAGKDLMGV